MWKSSVMLSKSIAISGTQKFNNVLVVCDIIKIMLNIT